MDGDESPREISMNSVGEFTAQDLLTDNYLHCFAVSILFYDYILTFVDEVHFIWRRPKSISAMGFLVNRYIAVIGHSVSIVFEFNTISDSSCEGFQVFRQYLLLANQLAVDFLLLLRIYALYSRDRRILAVLVGGIYVVMIISLWVIIGQHTIGVPINLYGCHLARTLEEGAYSSGPWEALLAWDILVFALTLYKTYTSRHKHNISPSSTGLALVTLVLRDGTFYFAAIGLANLANLFTFYCVHQPLLRGALSSFAGCLSVTLVSRLTLNLHKNAETGLLSDRHSSTQIPSDLMLTSRIDVEDSTEWDGGSFTVTSDDETYKRSSTCKARSDDPR